MSFVAIAEGYRQTAGDEVFIRLARCRANSGKSPAERRIPYEAEFVWQYPGSSEPTEQAPVAVASPTLLALTVNSTGCPVAGTAVATLNAMQVPVQPTAMWVPATGRWRVRAIESGRNVR